MVCASLCPQSDFQPQTGSSWDKALYFLPLVWVGSLLPAAVVSAVLVSQYRFVVQARLSYPPSVVQQQQQESDGKCTPPCCSNVSLSVSMEGMVSSFRTLSQCHLPWTGAPRFSHRRWWGRTRASLFLWLEASRWPDTIILVLVGTQLALLAAQASATVCLQFHQGLVVVFVLELILHGCAAGPLWVLRHRCPELLLAVIAVITAPLITSWVTSAVSLLRLALLLFSLTPQSRCLSIAPRLLELSQSWRSAVSPLGAVLLLWLFLAVAFAAFAAVFAVPPAGFASNYSEGEDCSAELPHQWLLLAWSISMGAENWPVYMSSCSAEWWSYSPVEPAGGCTSAAFAHFLFLSFVTGSHLVLGGMLLAVFFEVCSFFVEVFLCICVCVFVCIHVCMYVCVYVVMVCLYVAMVCMYVVMVCMYV